MSCKVFHEEFNCLQPNMLLSVALISRHLSANEIVVLRFTTSPSHSLGQVCYNFVGNPGKHFGQVFCHVIQHAETYLKQKFLFSCKVRLALSTPWSHMWQWSLLILNLDPRWCKRPISRPVRFPSGESYSIAHWIGSWMDPKPLWRLWRRAEPLSQFYQTRMYHSVAILPPPPLPCISVNTVCIFLSQVSPSVNSWSCMN